MFCRNYFINMLNRWGVLSIRFCIWPLLLGWLLGCQKKQVEGTCGSLLSSCSIGIWWNGKSIVISYWGSLLGTSTNWIPLIWECGCSFESPHKQVVVAFLIIIAFYGPLWPFLTFHIDLKQSLIQFSFDQQVVPINRNANKQTSRNLQTNTL